MPHTVAMVLCAPFPAPRGTQGWVAELCRALLADGHAVHLWCHPGRGDGWVPEGLVVHRARPLPFVDPSPGSSPSLSRPLNDAALMGRMALDLMTVQPTVVHSHNHEAGLVAAAAARMTGVPLVHQVHSRLAEELPAWTGRGARVGRALDRLVPQTASHVLFLDPAGTDVAASRPHTVLPPGVAPRRSGIEVDLGPHTIAYAGNLDPYQDLPRLFAAMRHVHAAMREVRLVLLTHDHKASAEHIIAAHDLPEGAIELRCVRTPEDAGAWLTSATVAVVPRGTGGGYPVKMLNALGLGVPVVTTEAGSKGLGEAEGVVTTLPDPLGLAEGLLGVLIDPERRDRLAEGARAFAEAHPFEEVARVCTEVYDAVTV